MRNYAIREQTQHVEKPYVTYANLRCEMQNDTQKH